MKNSLICFAVDVSERFMEQIGGMKWKGCEVCENATKCGIRIMIVGSTKAPSDKEELKKFEKLVVSVCPIFEHALLWLYENELKKQ